MNTPLTSKGVCYLRMQCVEMLREKGLKFAQIAAIMRCGKETARRYQAKSEANKKKAKAYEAGEEWAIHLVRGGAQ